MPAFTIRWAILNLGLTLKTVMPGCVSDDYIIISGVGDPDISILKTFPQVIPPWRQDWEQVPKPDPESFTDRYIVPSLVSCM